MSTQSQAPFTAFFGTSFLAIIALIVGLMMSVIGGHELLTALRCGDAPIPMSVAQLATQGPTTSDFVSLSDFEIQWDGYVYWMDEQGRWTSCDVPLRAAGSSAPPRVLIRVCHAQNESDVRHALAGSELTGIVTGRGLFAEYGATLAQYNPGIDPAACWIVTLGKEPFDARALAGIVFGGMTLLTLGVFLFVYVKPANTPAQATLRMMSPLIVLVEGLHALADKLPLSRRTCGLFLFPPTAALATWGGFQLWEAVQTGSATSAFGVEVPGILALDFGVAFALVALSFLLVEPKEQETAELVSPGPGFGAQGSGFSR